MNSQLFAYPAANKTGRRTSVVKARLSPSMIDIHRAAAWWGGEGSVASTGGRLTVAIAQKEKEVLLWIMDRFGGAVHSKKSDKCSAWIAHGSRARGFLQTIFSCLPESPRRQNQILAALKATNRIKKRGPPPAKKCIHGHPKTPGKNCRVCARAAQNATRKTMAGAEKHRAAERERYQRRVKK